MLIGNFDVWDLLACLFGGICDLFSFALVKEAHQGPGDDDAGKETYNNAQSQSQGKAADQARTVEEIPV